MSVRISLRLLTCSLCAAVSMTAARGEEIPASALAKAKTIEVTARASLVLQDGKSLPLYASTVQAQRPDHLNVIARTLSANPAKPTPDSRYVQDGAQVHQYAGPLNMTMDLDLPPRGLAGSSRLCELSGADIVMRGGVVAPVRHWTRAVTRETVDGHEAILITDTHRPSTLPNGKSYTRVQQLWLDPKTGLPIRSVGSAESEGKLLTKYQVDFSDWKLNLPLAPSTFAWTAPDGAKPSTEPRLLAVGAPAPDFTVVDPQGGKLHLSSLKGKVVVIDFWATWCGPCQASMPHLDGVYKQVKDQGVVFLPICVQDDKERFDQWVAAKQSVYSFPAYYDPAGKGADEISGRLYHVSGIPGQYIIDKEGKVAARTIGYNEDGTFLEDALTKLGVKVKVED